MARLSQDRTGFALAIAGRGVAPSGGWNPKPPPGGWPYTTHPASNAIVVVRIIAAILQKYSRGNSNNKSISFQKN
jgi:hypothetical protein